MKEFFPLHENAVVVMDDAMVRSLLRRHRRTGDFLRFDLRKASDFHAQFSNRYYVECYREFGLMPAHAKMLQPYLAASMTSNSTDLEISEWKRIATHLLSLEVMSLPRPIPPSRVVECYNDPRVDASLMPDARVLQWTNPQPTPFRMIVAKDERAQLRLAIQLAAKWIEEGSSPEDITIANVSEDDRFYLQTLARRYGFEVSAKQRIPWIQLPQVARFWQLAETIHPKAALQEAFPDESDPLRTGVSEIISLYEPIPDPKPFWRFEFEHNSLSTPTMRPAVRLCAWDELTVFDDAKTIVLYACEGMFPSLCQDDDLLRDAKKPMLGIPTSIEENAIRRRRVRQAVEAIPDLILISPSKIKGSPAIPLDLASYSRASVPLEMTDEWLAYAQKDARFVHGALVHDQRTYGIQSPLYHKLQATFSDRTTYDPRFQGIDPETNQRLRPSPHPLSATSLETFFACRFRYLLTHLLKMEPSAPSLASAIGTAVHRRLETLRTDSLTELNDPAYGLARLLTFSLATNARMERVVSRLLNHLEQSAFRDVASEAAYRIPIEGTTDFELKGRIDRIMAYRDGETDYLVVIDYKTGNASFSEADFEQGIDLQLIVYLELIRKHSGFNRAQFAGFFYQPIPLGRLSEKADGDDLEQRMKMKGYILDHAGIAKAFDPGGFVRGLQFKNDGTFHARTKTFDQDRLNQWFAQLSRHLQTAISQIEEGDYRITPIAKKPGEADSVSCQYCPFSGICYLSHKRPQPEEDAVESEDVESWQD